MSRSGEQLESSVRAGESPAPVRVGPVPLPGAAGLIPVLEALDAAVALVRPDWRIAWVNRAWADVFAARADTLPGRHISSLLPAAAEADGAALLSAVLSDGRARVLQTELRGGVPCDVRVSRVGDPTAEGGVALVLRAQALAEHDEHYAARVEENAALRALARQMAEVSDSDALLRLLAEAARAQCHADVAVVEQLAGDESEVVAVAGAQRGSPRGRRFPLHGSLTERAVQSRTMVVETNYAEHVGATRGWTGGAEIGPMLLVPLVAHDTVLGVLSVMRHTAAPPFSAREEQRLGVIADHASLALWKARLFEEAQAASQAKSNFIATVSHELRTPLTALTGYGELLADEILGPMPKQQHEIVERMRSVTHHLTAMIDEILTFASLEAGGEQVRLAECGAAEVARAAQAVVEPFAMQKGVGFVVEAPAGFRLLTDCDKLRQILVNLAGNAVKFTERGTVRVAVEDADGVARFAVHDTGIGISADDLRRLFQPFSQLDAGLTRRHGGTGLGLYIAHRLARLLGGRIDVASELGRGSVFTLTIPRGR
ncbi:MAG: ATP-binding protein [Gemmatimonadaceae bacterium]